MKEEDISKNKNQIISKPSVNQTSDFKKMLKTFFQYIHYRGLYSALVLAFNSIREWLWFASHRKSSISFTNINAIEEDLANKAHSTFYVPTPIIPFVKLVRALNLPDHCVFVDYGAGKGRAMILASECGFYKVKGIEFSSSLYESAQRNIQSYIKKTGKDCFHLIHTDVLDYQVKKEDNFFYFFHPFNEDILDQCVKNICLSLQKDPRRGLLVYQKSNYKDSIDCITKSGFFRLFKSFVSFGTHFYVYEHSPY